MRDAHEWGTQDGGLSCDFKFHKFRCCWYIYQQQLRAGFLRLEFGSSPERFSSLIHIESIAYWKIISANQEMQSISLLLLVYIPATMENNRSRFWLPRLLHSMCSALG
jgi:hypothetical protein